jgi:protoheme IX farnesyltransferase
VPHFAAIAIFRADDYARAGLQVVSVQHGESAARRTMAAWTALLVGATMFFGPLGLAGRAYTWIATALGAGFLALALRGIIMSPRRDVLGPRRAGRSWAKGVFAYSILYLSVLLIALLLDRA